MTNLFSKIKGVFPALTLLCAFSVAAQAQDSSSTSSGYVPPAEADVQANIEQWQDLKFGMFIHWGTYSQLGCVESWSLIPGDIDWQMRSRRDRGMGYFEYLKFYEQMKTTFNPLDFDPAKWAAAAKDAGMKYMVFTTKHHDGFCMFDTAQTDYKITSSECPFHTSPRANIAKEVFEAFRAEGIMTGAYFSVPDWHHDDYWWRMFPPRNTSVNYDPARHPEKWAAYQDFFNAQIDELTCGVYGDIPLLWLDLADAPAKEGAVVDWERAASTLRKNRPGAMMVARGLHNIYENYRTPEQEMPSEALDYPWESCYTMTYSWAYRPGLTYKSTQTILDMLVKIVTRGGNFLLNVGPKPDGTLEDVAYERLRDIGAWMKVNSEGIYGTRAIAPYQVGDVYFSSKADTVYAFCLAPEGENTIPAAINIGPFVPSGRVTMLGSDKPLRCKQTPEGTVVTIPESLRRSLPCDYVWCLKFAISE